MSKIYSIITWQKDGITIIPFFTLKGEGLSQYLNMPVFMESLQKFADHNRFEIHDVMADGNCLFRAIADQLEINGIFGNSPKLLREITMK